VGEVFIPKKVDKWGKRFAFVKFREVGDTKELEERMQEVRCGEELLKVNLARFRREEEAWVSTKILLRGESSNAAKVTQGTSYEVLAREGGQKWLPLVKVAETAPIQTLVVQPSEEMV